MNYEVFCSLIRESFPGSTDIPEITPELYIDGDLGFCSFDMMLLLSLIEKECGHDLDVSSLKKHMTVQDLFELAKEG